MRLLFIHPKARIFATASVRDELAEGRMMETNRPVSLPWYIEHGVEVRQCDIDLVGLPGEQFCQRIPRQRRKEQRYSPNNLAQCLAKLVFLLHGQFWSERGLQDGDVDLV